MLAYLVSTGVSAFDAKAIGLLFWKGAAPKPLRGSPAKSGPLDFGTKNNFPSFFVSEKGLTHIEKSNLLFSNSLFLLCYEPKLNFGRTEVADRDQKGKIHRFCEACYVA